MVNASARNRSSANFNGPKIESITFFLTSEREARIRMHTCLVCGSESFCLSGEDQTAEEQPNF